MEFQQLLFILLILVTVLMIFQLGILLGFVKVLQSFKKKPPEEIIEKTRQQSRMMIRQALAQAQKILVASELEGIHEMSKQKLAGKEIAEEFNKHLKELERYLKQQFDTNTKDVEESYKGFISQIEKSVTDHIKRNDEMIQQKAGGMIAKSEELLTAFVTDVQNKVKAELDKTLGEAQKEIAEYKMRRIRVIDERIVDMLEDIIEVALEKKLTLVEQSELVYRALEEAKRENAFTGGVAQPGQSAQSAPQAAHAAQAAPKQADQHPVTPGTKPEGKPEANPQEPEPVHKPMLGGPVT